METVLHFKDMYRTGLLETDNNLDNLQRVQLRTVTNKQGNLLRLPCLLKYTV